jgi:hypothetical protein
MAYYPGAPPTVSASENQLIVKIHGKSDADGSGSPGLCERCAHSTVIRGAGRTAVRCHQVNKTITFKVESCSGFYDKTLPSVAAMEEIAWLLVTKSTGKEIGFMRVKEMTDADRRKHNI